MLTQRRLKEVLKYYPNIGQFVWRKPPKYHPRMKEKIAGSFRYGYRVISIDGGKYPASRLAFLYMIGRFPMNLVDHIDCNRSNDRWANLREATRLQNARNRSIGKPGKALPMGVRMMNGKYQSRISVMKKMVYLGCFQSENEAHLAYICARNRYFGEFA